MVDEFLPAARHVQIVDNAAADHPMKKKEMA
jgi:hypothetical protein